MSAAVPQVSTDLAGLRQLAEELREYTAMKYAGDCKCGKCQLVPRPLVERLYHTLNSYGGAAQAAPDSGKLKLIETIIYENASVSHFGEESEVDNAAFLAREILAAISPIQPAPEPAPSGWKLVPERPTKSQMDAGLYQSSADSTWADVYSIYADMIDAAPSIDDGSEPVADPRSLRAALQSNPVQGSGGAGYAGRDAYEVARHIIGYLEGNCDLSFANVKQDDWDAITRLVATLAMPSTDGGGRG
jgi:hypothetical protein